MAVDTVRRLSKPTGEQRQLTDHITQFDWKDSEEITTPDLLSGSKYPFKGQERQYRSFEFTTDPMFGSPTKTTGVLEIREESGLIFLILDQDAPKPDTIFSELAEASEDGLEIESDFSPTYGEVCEFIRKAERVVKLETPPGVENAQERIEKGENLPIEIARLRFSHDGESNRVTYSDGQLEIPLNLNGRSILKHVAQEDTFREYVVQVFETTFSS